MRNDKGKVDRKAHQPKIVDGRGTVRVRYDHHVRRRWGSGRNGVWLHYAAGIGGWLSSGGRVDGCRPSLNREDPDYPGPFFAVS